MSDLYGRHIRKGVAIYPSLLREKHRNIESTSDGAYFPLFLTCRSLQSRFKCVYLSRSKNDLSKAELRTINNYHIYVRIYTNDSIII